MESNQKAFDGVEQGSLASDKPLQQYGLGSTRFAGAPDALYERHLKFDNVVELGSSDLRERYEAAARSIRDILSDRWLRTDETYARENPKRVYYISIEFLIGRSLANNIMNLTLDPVVERTFDEHGHDWWEILHEERDAGLGNGGLGRLAACFLDSMATMQLPAMGYGLRYEHGIFKQRIRNGWQEERPDNWLRHPDPWEVVRPNESVEVTFPCSFEVRAGSLRMVPQGPTTLIGVPYDRPVIGYGGKTVNTLRLWSATATHAFDFQRFSGGDFIASIAEALNAESLTRVLYPDDHTPQGRGLRLMQEYFLVACSLADAVRRFRESNTDWRLLPEKAAIQLNDTHPSLAVPELMRILLDEAHLGWDEAWDITRATLAYTNHTLLPEALERWPVEWMEALIPRPLEIIYEINRRLLEDIRARFPGDSGRAARISLVEEGQMKQIRMANSGDRRFPQHQWGRRNPFRTVAQDDGARPRRGVSRTLQQQDQRGHAEALASTGESGPRCDDFGRHRRLLDRRPRTIAKAAAAGDRRRLPGRGSQGSARLQSAVRRLGEAAYRDYRRSGHDLRLSGEAHSRIQASAAQRLEDRRSL